ncbi:MAG TPA: hypothetical protein DF480_04475, partial [Clostridiales bacterium]|nr:hypothetical protein [Clostridiales bacterium]
MAYRTDRGTAIRDPSHWNRQLLIEFLLAVFLSIAASIAAFSNIAAMDSQLFNVTADGLGHLAKVAYLAEHFQKLEFPSWCPFWYNGSTMMQYYAPLGYVVMAGIHILIDDIVLTMKWYCLICLSLGGLGVWAISRRFIGQWYGLFGVVLYCLQPFFALSLFGGGVYAQGVIFLFTPWLLLFVVDFLIDPRSSTFFGIAILTALLILGHAMHAFMIGLMIAVVALPYALSGKIRFQSYFMLGVSMVIAALMCGFWWAVGITGYEAPGVPYLLEEATLLYTAIPDWFIPGKSSILKFSLATQACVVLSFLIYHYMYRRTWAPDRRQFCVSMMIYLSIVSVIFSFGQNFSVLRAIPFIETLVPGRILNLTAVTAAVAGSYILFSLLKNFIDYRLWRKSAIVMMCILLIGLSLYEMNPFVRDYSLEHYDSYYRSYMPFLAGSGDRFEKGRYEWIAPVNASETYYSTQVYGYNASDGWNIEGTPHNRTIWGNNVALSSGAEEYVLKDLFFWNVRSVYVAREYAGLLSTLKKYGFSQKVDPFLKTGSSGILYTSDQPSSYFLTDPRDSLVIGPGAIAMAHEYPYMVHEYETDLMKYTLSELEQYKVIYITEPILDSVSRIRAFEDRVTQLVDQGIHVLIEPSSLLRFPLFGVGVNNLKLSAASAVLARSDAREGSAETDIILRAGRQFFSLTGLDHVEYKLYSGQDRAGFDMIGTQKVGQGEVIFIGGRLTQYLQSPSFFIWGFQEEDIVPDVASLKAIITDLIDRKEHGSTFVPGTFDVLSSAWDYKGGTFAYSIDEAQEVTVS